MARLPFEWHFCQWPWN